MNTLQRGVWLSRTRSGDAESLTMYIHGTQERYIYTHVGCVLRAAVYASLDLSSPADPIRP